MVQQAVSTEDGLEAIEKMIQGDDTNSTHEAAPGKDNRGDVHDLFTIAVYTHSEQPD
jgi:hypothetical protein